MIFLDYRRAVFPSQPMSLKNLNFKAISCFRMGLKAFTLESPDNSKPAALSLQKKHDGLQNLR